MLTQCPACLTIFRVTGPILRMGHGQVRCGRCEQQFDALERLLDDEEEAMQTGEVRAIKRTLDTPAPSLDDVHPEKTQSATLPTSESTSESTAPAETFSPEIDLSATDERPIVAANEFPAEPLIDSEEAVGAEPWGSTTISIPADAIPPPVIPSHTDDEFRNLREEINQPASITHALTEREELDLLSGARSRSHVRQERKGLWPGLSVAFALVLLMQIVHHYRQDLVRHPRLGSVMTKVYGAFGIPLSQAWDLTAYEIQQWGATSDPTVPGTLRVRATIGNVAGFAQPYPVLRFVLEDRWGDAVGSRDFAPQEYLEPGTPIDRLLSPNQRASVDVAIMDPGQDAVGFRWSICLPQPEGMQCESDIAHS